jgi:hypothetical protein
MADFYFDGANGNDTTGLGTEANPYKTIRTTTIGGAFNPLNARFFIKRGTIVSLSNTSVYPQGTFYIGPYGDGYDDAAVDYNSIADYFFVLGIGSTASDSIVFDRIKLIDTREVTTASGIYQHASGACTLTVKDCKIVGFLNGVMTQKNDRHQFLRNNITRTRNCGIIIEHSAAAAANNLLIAGNYIDNTLGSNDAISLHAGSGSGVGNVVRGNTLIAGTEQAIDILAMYPGTLVADNVVYANPASVVSLWSDIFCRGANSLIFNNLIFSRNRLAIDIDAANVNIRGNTIVNSADVGVNALIRIQGTGANTSITHNHLIMKSNFSAAGIIPLTGATTGKIKNNVMVSYSANAGFNFISAQTFANLATWDIDYNCYAQMTGSKANAWAGLSIADWRASAGSHDVNSIILNNVLPLQIPSFLAAGQSINIRNLYKVPAGSDLIEAGAHEGYYVDSAGNQFWNPPSIGPVEYLRPKSARS